MTISSTTRSAGPYSGDGTTTAFAFSFKVFEKTDLLVITTTSSVNTELTYGTGYTVTLNGDQDNSPGGTVTLTAALASGSTLKITSNVPATQSVSLQNQGGFYPKVITNALDRLTALVQQIMQGVAQFGTLVADTVSVKTEVVSTSISTPIINVDTVAEYTSGHGVVVDEVTIKDATITGIGTLVATNVEATEVDTGCIKVDNIYEMTTGTGVYVEGVCLKDSSVTISGTLGVTGSTVLSNTLSIAGTTTTSGRVWSSPSSSADTSYVAEVGMSEGFGVAFKRTSTLGNGSYSPLRGLNSTYTADEWRLTRDGSGNVILRTYTSGTGVFLITPDAAIGLGVTAAGSLYLNNNYGATASGAKQSIVSAGSPSPAVWRTNCQYESVWTGSATDVAMSSLSCGALTGRYVLVVGSVSDKVSIDIFDTSIGTLSNAQYDADNTHVTYAGSTFSAYSDNGDTNPVAITAIYRLT